MWKDKFEFTCATLLFIGIFSIVIALLTEVAH